MPELPEVETIARSLRPQILGKRILDAEVRWARTIAMPDVRTFRRWIRGQVVTGVGRRAKLIDIHLSSYHLLIHLRMSGDLQVRNGTAGADRHDRLILRLGKGGERGGSNDGPMSLAFNDTRKFGRVWLTQEHEAVTRSLGPEPLGSQFTADVLYARLQARRRQLKPLLLDQQFLAGLGNIYTDEALHRARLHPLRSSQSLTRRQATRLHAAIQETLREGIRRNGASIDWVYRGGEFQNHFRVYGRDGEPCPVCGTRIRRLVIGQRGTHICPRCQRK